MYTGIYILRYVRICPQLQMRLYGSYALYDFYVIKPFLQTNMNVNFFATCTIVFVNLVFIFHMLSLIINITLHQVYQYVTLRYSPIENSLILIVTGVY